MDVFFISVDASCDVFCFNVLQELEYTDSDAFFDDNNTCQETLWKNIPD